MLLFAGDFRSVFWVAVVPGLLSVSLLVMGIQESERAAGISPTANPLHLRVLREFDSAYWWIVLAGGVFTLARFSEAFLLLRAQQQGLPDTYAPFVLVVMNVVFALTAYPMGRLADRVNPIALLGAGLAVLIAGDIVLARADSLRVTGAGVALWGLHMGMTQGVLASMVAANSPAHLRGTAFGFFNLISGVAMLIASVLAGFLWDRYGAPVTFYAGATFALVAFLLFAVARTGQREHQKPTTR
jgi:predicted MFS family arabinose efflux permease